MSNYFNTTPLNKWDTVHCTEYFNTKHKINIVNIDGVWLSTAKLKQYRTMFGKSLGEKIYLIVRDRLERESDVVPVRSPSMQIVSPIATVRSPSMQIVSPIATVRSPVMSVRSPVMPVRSPIVQAGSPITSAWSPISMYMSPITLHPMAMSDLDLNATNNITTDTRALAHIAYIKKRESKLLDKYEYVQLTEHIEKHPPLLWNDDHLHLFLASIVKCEIPIIPNVDDFIFMSADEMNVYFPNKGAIIKSLLLSKFIDPSIKKLASNDHPAKSVP